MKKKGEPIYYGDGTSAEILHKLRVKHARMLVIAISDAAATRRTVQIARQENPSLYIIVRTRYVTETEDLKALGANEVIPEEFETSVEIFSRVLHHYHVPLNVIREHADLIRSNSYRMLRTIPLPRKHLHERYDLLKGLDTDTFLVKAGSPVEGHSLEQIRLRSETGATVIVVRRGDEVFQNPQPSFVLAAGDILLLVGTRDNIERAVGYLSSESHLAERYYR
jgi:CPA2 family monovalent cation:H+ antiporter-2